MKFKAHIRSFERTHALTFQHLDEEVIMIVAAVGITEL